MTVATQKILVTGACGQIGTELVYSLMKRHGSMAIFPTDIRAADGSFTTLNVLDKTALGNFVAREGITQIYHLAAALSATAELKPMLSWDLNMQGLFNVLEAARLCRVEKVFWPSSIAVFGPGSFSAACPQNSVLDPITIYGISKVAGESWCRYYHEHYGLDIRSIRYPGLISHTAEPGGGTTDYAVDIFSEVILNGKYRCYLRENTGLPMMYMADAIRAAIELMEAPKENITIRTAYNLAAINFTPKELVSVMKKLLGEFRVDYAPDFRQRIADSWPSSIVDLQARHDWGWAPEYELPAIVSDMVEQMTLKVAHGHA
jgi:nucleoside-diphosphate-sugar epimerase